MQSTFHRTRTQKRRHNLIAPPQFLSSNCLCVDYCPSPEKFIVSNKHTKHEHCRLTSRGVLTWCSPTRITQKEKREAMSIPCLKSLSTSIHGTSMTNDRSSTGAEFRSHNRRACALPHQRPLPLYTVRLIPTKRSDLCEVIVTQSRNTNICTSL